MSKELVISSNAHETKVAVMEDDQLVEIYFQRTNEYSLAGSIHKGRVTRVLPGMQSAFVDLGLERDTFLYVSDFFEENGEEYDRVVEDRPPSREERTPSRSQERKPSETPKVHQAPPVQPPPLEVAETAEETEPREEPVVERVEDTNDRRDRGGRRSRRRRSRGRGFPESKYASELSSGTAAAVEEVGATPEEPAPFNDVILLPGESLAKYRGRTQEAGEAATEEDEDSVTAEIEAAVDWKQQAAENAVEPAEEPEEEPEPARAEPAEETPVSAAAVEQAHAEPAAEETAPPASDAAAGSSRQAVVSEAAEETEPSGETPGENLAAEEVIEQIEAAAVEDSTEAAEAAAEAQPEAELENESEQEEESVTDEEPGPVVEEVTNEPRSASVRDQSGRYQHRGSRRMRRKRGGGGGAEQPHQQPSGLPEQAPPEQRAARGEKPLAQSISDLLREGQEIIVQIAKEPLGQKGARITSHIALPGRFVVFMPTLEHLGVSRKISTEEERLRLKKLLLQHRGGIAGGFIVRTAGEGRTEEEIAGDMAYLYNLWLDIRQKAEKKKAPALLHHDLDIVQRILRDQLSDMFKAVWVDNEDVYESVVRFMQRFQPGMVGRVKLYTRPTPIFDTFNVSQEIEKALRPKVWLKSGGYIVVNQTEALVAIDVNTGKYVGKSNRLEDTITKTNTEAVKEIVRQIRLRDLGGIIVIDFIDMDERKNRQKVMQVLEEAMRADRAPYKILQFNDFGLVAITRKRVKQSLERSLCAPCPTCDGAGYVKSVATVIGEILQEATKIRPLVEGKNVVLRVYPETAKVLKSNTNHYLEEIEAIVARPVMVLSDPMLAPDKFDMAW